MKKNEELITLSLDDMTEAQKLAVNIVLQEGARNEQDRIKKLFMQELYDNKDGDKYYDFALRAVYELIFEQKPEESGINE